MTQKGIKKGRSLETAINRIQDAILRSDPRLAGSKFSIEPNKIVTVLGVRHEFDLYIRTLPDSSYESIFVFECKNWRKTVGKNEVMNLGAKVHTIGAAHGYLVARKFSKDAVAQANQEKRVTLLHVNDDFATPATFEMRGDAHQLITLKVDIKEYDVPPVTPPPQISLDGKEFRLQGQVIDIQAFLIGIADKMALQERRENIGKYQEEGSHSVECAELLKFERGELLFDGASVEHFVLNLKFNVIVRKAKLISKFELKDQGRFFSFEPMDDFIQGNRLHIELVQRIQK